MKHKKLIAYTFLILTFCSCSPKLNLFEIEEKINKRNTAHFEGNIEHMLKNIPVKSLKKNGEERYRKNLKSIFNGKRKDPVYYGNIGELYAKDIDKCHSYFYYDVKYLVTKFERTPYIDSTALKLNYEEYGKENVNFNPNSKILEVRERKHKLLVFDKDRNWKILTYDVKSLERNFGKKFVECIESK